MEATSHTLKIQVYNACKTYPETPLYLHGDFNQWNPKGTFLGTAPVPGTQATFTLDGLPSGLQDFKLSRGSMQSLLGSSEGQLAGPLQVDPSKTETIQFHIHCWRDQYPPSTALQGVHERPEPFHFKRWNKHKKIWIYLPENYADSKMHFPVLYMHDGQDLFDEALAAGKTGPVEWGVDEAVAASHFPCIVVGIERASSKERMQEYLLEPFDQIEEPSGKLYIQDLVGDLKPYIDAHYRTLPQAAYTAMAGSSLGGLLSLYAGLYYPQTFGCIGAFSPSLWMDSGMLMETARKVTASDKQYYHIYAGGAEHRNLGKHKANMLEHARQMGTLLQAHPQAQVYMDLQPNGRHGAWYWKQAFPKFYAHWVQYLQNNLNEIT